MTKLWKKAVRWLVDYLSHIVPGQKLGGHSTTALSFDVLAKELPAGVLVATNAGEVLYANSFAHAIFALNAEKYPESIFDHIEHLLQDQQDISSLRTARNMSAAGEPYHHSMRIGRQALTVWLEHHISPIFNPQGDVDSFLMLFFDVTKRQRLTQEVQRVNADLEDFNYMVSHDLRAPLVTLRGCLGMLSKNNDTLKAEKAFSMATEAVTRLNDLIAGLAEYGKITRLGLTAEPVPANSILEQTLATLQAQWEEPVNISIPQPLPDVYGHHLALSQVFQNLLQNAYKYREKTRQLELAITFEQGSGNTIILCFSDNGIGIPEERVPHIFRPFQRAHQSSGKHKAIPGTGIGLACVEKLMLKMNGKIWVESHADQGSAFFLELSV